MFSIVKVFERGKKMKFYSSSDMFYGESVEKFLRRLNPMVMSFSHIAIKTERGNFIVFCESDFVGADKNVLEGNLLPFRTLDGFVFAFFGDVWLLPFDDKKGNIEIKDKKKFKDSLIALAEDALDYVEKNGTESLVMPQNIYNGLPESDFDFSKEVKTDVSESFSNMSVYMLEHSETLVRLLCKTMLISGLYFDLVGDKSLPLNRLLNIPIAKKIFPKKDYLDLISRLHYAITSIFCFYARLVAEYSGAIVSDLEKFSMLTNPGIAADAIRKAINAGRMPVVGRMLLSRTSEISQLFGAYNFYMSYMLDVDGIEDEIPPMDGEITDFYEAIDSDEKNEELARKIAGLVAELAEDDARSAPAFKISSDGLAEILWGTGM